MVRWTLQSPLLPLLLLLVLLAKSSTGSHGASSAVLRHSRIAGGRLYVAPTRSLLLQASGSTGTASAFAVRSGFRQFSQRATRLQRTHRSLRWKSVLGDVVTNKSDKSPDDSSCHSPLIANIAAVTAHESWNGFLGGYLLRAASHSTQQLVRQIRRPVSTAPWRPQFSLAQFSLQSRQWHCHNLQSAAQWAKISALFAVGRMLVGTLRGREDGWNGVAGSAVAGAILAVAPTPNLLPLANTMTRSALFYAGTMFLVQPDLWMEALSWMPAPPSTATSPPWYPLMDI